MPHVETRRTLQGVTAVGDLVWEPWPSAARTTTPAAGWLSLWFWFWLWFLVRTRFASVVCFWCMSWPATRTARRIQNAERQTRRSDTSTQTNAWHIPFRFVRSVDPRATRSVSRSLTSDQTREIILVLLFLFPAPRQWTRLGKWAPCIFNDRPIHRQSHRCIHPVVSRH